MLPPGAVSLSELSGTWWIAHTKSRAEKVFCWELLDRGCGYFLPVIEKIRFSGGRKRVGLLPLFPSYVFFCGDWRARYSALTTNRLCTVLEVKDQEKLVQELLWIEAAVKSKRPLDIYPHAAIGRTCRIRSGPLAGIQGVVVQENNVTGLALQVSLLGQGAVLSIHPDLLEPIN